jgi:hypothetical protein
MAFPSISLLYQEKKNKIFLKILLSFIRPNFIIFNTDQFTFKFNFNLVLLLLEHSFYSEFLIKLLKTTILTFIINIVKFTFRVKQKNCL